MKRKWYKRIDSEYGCEVFVCKICGFRRLRKRAVLYHTQIHDKWEKREFERNMLSFNFFNIYKNKPLSYFVGQVISIEGLFEVGLFEV